MDLKITKKILSIDVQPNKLKAPPPNFRFLAAGSFDTLSDGLGLNEVEGTAD